MFSQIGLKLWKEEYSEEWIIGKSNEIATDIVLNSAGQIFLTGPEYSGKKHLAHKIGHLQKCDIYIVEYMSDREIIEKYDECNAKNIKAIWVNSKNNNVAKDCISRFSAMHRAKITELSDDMVYSLLNQRFKSIGFMVSNEIINYCIYRLPRTYEAVEMCIRWARKNNKANLSAFREFFGKMYFIED